MPSKRVLLLFFLSILAVVAVESLIYLLAPTSLQPLIFKLSALSIMVIAYLVIFIDLIFLIPTIKGAIYYPSTDRQIMLIKELARLKIGQTVVDIGSGDGRVVAALSAAGLKAVGIELNPILVLYSRWKYRKTHPGAEFYWRNLWQTNFREYDVVVLFGMTYIMKDMEHKLMNELKPGAKVIANSFPFPTWKHQKKIDSVYLYVKE